MRKGLLIILLFVSGCAVRSPFYIKPPKQTYIAPPVENWDVLSLLPQEKLEPLVERIVAKKIELMEQETTPKKQAAQWMNVYLGMTIVVVVIGAVLCSWKSKWGWPLIIGGGVGCGMVVLLQEHRALIGWLLLIAGVAIALFKMWDYHTERDQEREKLKQNKHLKP